MSIARVLAGVETVDAPKVLGEQVVVRLRHLVITGEIAPGSHLVETELAKAFNVSRGPIREALRQLLTEGLVGSRRGRIYVIGVTPDDVEELYHLRFLIEGEALRLAARSAKKDGAPLRVALARLREAQEADDPSLYAARDLDFHTAFYAVAGHRRLQDVWLRYRPTFAGILAVTNAEDLDLEPSYQDHVVLLDAVETGQLDLALDTLEDHLAGSKERFLKAQQRRTEASSS